MDKHYTIVIQRQFGSQGRNIARIVADRLGIKFYDRDIVEKVATTLGLPVSQIAEEEEKAGTGLRYIMAKFPLGTDDAYMQNMIFQVQKDIILDVAERENCIIVGRCADYLLKNRKDNLNIYIYAPYSYRLETCIKTYGMTADEAKHMIASVDKARNNYHKLYTGTLPSDPENMDLMINSSIISIEDVADTIVEIAKKRFGIKENPHVVI